MKDVDESLFFSGKYKVGSIETGFGGDALNESTVLRHFNEDVKLITIVGEDMYGDQIIRHLDELEIPYNANIRKKGIATYISMVFIDKDGQRRFVGNENGSLRVFDLDDIMIDEDCRIVSFASLFHSKRLDNAKLNILFKSIKEKDILLCADCSNHKNNETIKDMDCLKYVDYFFCNELEARQLCGEHDIEDLEKILYDAGIGNVIIKCAEKGCFYKGEYHETEAVDCIDSTGAGDSFVAGFIEGLDKGLNIEETIRKANRYGSKACEYIGATRWLDHYEG